MNFDVYKRVIAVGDVHGQYDKLVDLWNKINYNDDEDFVIFLGDYIDRGKKSVESLKFVKNLVENNKNVVALKGNHEDFMSNYFQRHHSDIWLDPCNGGNITLAQLEKLSVEEREDLLQFVNNLPLFYNKFDGYFFVHAGINPFSTKPFEKQDIEDYLWIREDFLDNYLEDTVVVVGHTPVQYYCNEDVPLKLENNIIMMDTGAAYGKKISAFDLKNMKVYQSK